MIYDRIYLIDIDGYGVLDNYVWEDTVPDDFEGEVIEYVRVKEDKDESRTTKR